MKKILSILTSFVVLFSIIGSSLLSVNGITFYDCTEEELLNINSQINTQGVLFGSVDEMPECFVKSSFVPLVNPWCGLSEVPDGYKTAASMYKKTVMEQGDEFRYYVNGNGNACITELGFDWWMRVNKNGENLDPLSVVPERLGDYAVEEIWGKTTATLYPSSYVRPLPDDDEEDTFYQVGCYSYTGANANNTFTSKIQMPATLKVIGNEVFYLNRKLRDVTIYSRDVAIYDDAFKFCTDITFHGYAGSTVEEFANSHGFDFEPLDETDADLDGKTDVNDVTCIQKGVAKLIELNTAQTAVSDINKDGKINITDATELQRIIAGLQE